ncbi:hypothetical protein [Geomonas anaerohicana]|uniref:Uncharacterized protein n=1 Tax=Geomonas anaerohicana TaxID=2798583 RepID=A0ABS0YFI3_9BACT|nr:hypothetical protein [Geomonas anaerohicana]MBJ6751066.1 hypothetical protein [Geomonas anaerohicana]
MKKKIMSLELPGVRKRRKILTAPELLKVEAEGMQLSKFTRVLMVGTLTLLYCMFIGGSVYNIVNHRIKNTEAYLQVFVPMSVIATAFLAVASLLIIKMNRSSLVFTEIGIAGTAMFSAVYEDLGGYAWEASSGLLATGQTSREPKKTLFITANKGWFPEVRYVTRMGTSVLASFGYYFKPDQIQKAEEILASRGIKRLPDRGK